MVILGIETSCDETAAALVEASGGLRKPRFRILTNVISSQVKLHRKFGGVVPMLASRQHEKNLPRIVPRALGGRTPHFIAVTRGPGLEPCLWRGLTFAQDLAENLGITILGINHLEGHVYSNWLQPVREIRNSKSEIRNKSQISNFKTIKPEFPAVCLIVSGGHTELIVMKGYGKYRPLGATRDDAVGEAYDKVARLLGLGYPGGPKIDAIASRYKIKDMRYTIKLPRPMIRTQDYDFSFAGLKTAVRYLVRDLRRARKRLPVGEICAEFQAAVIDVLVAKTLRAAREYRTKTIMVSGGVSANSGLRRRFAAVEDFPVRFPPKELTTDNAVMIAMAGYFNWIRGAGRPTELLAADPNLKIGE